MRNQFFLLALLLSAGSLSATGEPLKVYLFGGQSNQQGLGEVQDLSNSDHVEMPRVQYWNGGAFENLHPGVTQTSTNSSQFGPEIGFAQSFLESGTTGQIAIIKHWRSGTALSAGWADQNWLGETPGPGRANFYPGLSSDDPNRGTAYVGMIERFRDGLDALDLAGVDYTINGVIWVQGEQDSKNEDSAKQYATNLERLVARLNEDLVQGPDTMPLFFAQSLGLPPSGLVPGTGSTGSQPSRFLYRDALRESMANADAGSGHPDSITNAYLVSTDGLEMTDDVHYDANGQLELGHRFFETTQAAVPEPSAMTLLGCGLVTLLRRRRP